VARAGGKGKISNSLVAASCAAVLTVYAAGLWRTRDEARRMQVLAEERRPVRTEPPAATGTNAAVSEAAAPAPQPAPAKPAAAPPPRAAATAPSVPPVDTPAARPAAPQQVAEAIPPPPVALPQAPPAPADSGSADVSATSAGEPDPAPPLPPDPVVAPAGNWRDGTYTGWGTSRHGDIKAQVVIRNGRIVESSIASCETRWPCDVISSIIEQPVQRQSADVDRVSRATESANAYYYAVLTALEHALEQPAEADTTPR
jgi:uncharacterized protein with FMN-binding domain